MYRTDNEKNLYEYYKDMNKKTVKYLDSLNDEDRFKAPLLDFTKTKNFDELCGHQIKGTDIIIGQAIETIQFKMDEVGVKLKSEAAIVTERGCLSDFKPDPRYFYFDDNYVIFISEEGKNPYFALKVSDAVKLQK